MLHRRRSIRLAGYDYTQNGAYFVTICTYQRRCLFGEIVGEEMQRNWCGEIAAACWQAIPNHFAAVKLDAFVVMPNHVHGIILIDTPDSTMESAQGDGVGAQHAAPLRTHPHVVQSGSLSAIVRSYKSAVANQINACHQTPGKRIWQRNYYEHIVRNDRALNAIREYILFNPAHWAFDRENPESR